MQLTLGMILARMGRWHDLSCVCGHVAARLLDHVPELVTEEFVRVPTTGEVDVAPAREGISVDAGGQPSRARVGVDAHMREALAQLVPDRAVERPAG